MSHDSEPFGILYVCAGVCEYVFFVCECHLGGVLAHTHMCVNLNVLFVRCTHTRAHAHVLVRVCACMYVYVCVCVCVCVYVCVCMCVS